MSLKNFLREPATSQQPTSYMWATLLNFGLFDEIVTSFPIVGLPLLCDHLGLSYDQVGLLFATGACSAMLLEPIINVLSDRHSKRWWILSGLLCLIMSYAIAALSSNYGVLLLAFALYYPAVGAAVGLAEATLIDDSPAKSIETMTRWTLLANVGDILAPLLVTGIVNCHQEWPEICWLAACLWTGLFVLTAMQPFPRQATEERNAEDLTSRNKQLAREEEEKNTWRTLGHAVRNPQLLCWGLLALIPTMVDETLLGFVALYLHYNLHASEITIGLLLTGTLLSSLLGLLLLDRLPWLRQATNQTPHRLLADMLLLLTTHTIWLAGLALEVIGLGTAGWYPIAQAQTYVQLPGHSSLVCTVTGLGAPFEAIFPAIVGFLPIDLAY